MVLKSSIDNNYNCHLYNMHAYTVLMCGMRIPDENIIVQLTGKICAGCKAHLCEYFFKRQESTYYKLPSLILVTDLRIYRYLGPPANAREFSYLLCASTRMRCMDKTI